MLCPHRVSVAPRAPPLEFAPGIAKLQHFELAFLDDVQHAVCVPSHDAVLPLLFALGGGTAADQGLLRVVVLEELPRALGVEFLPPRCHPVVLAGVLRPVGPPARADEEAQRGADPAAYAARRRLIREVQSRPQIRFVLFKREAHVASHSLERPQLVAAVQIGVPGAKLGEGLLEKQGPERVSLRRQEHRPLLAFVDGNPVVDRDVHPLVVAPVVQLDRVLPVLVVSASGEHVADGLGILANAGHRGHQPAVSQVSLVHVLPGGGAVKQSRVVDFRILAVYEVLDHVTSAHPVNLAVDLGLRLRLEAAHSNFTGVLCPITQHAHALWEVPVVEHQAVLAQCSAGAAEDGVQEQEDARHEIRQDRAPHQNERTA
mmetsp:Transcript_4930/g.8039  ORF Transcript_4930/g.8039 Transcript_4930/m.8039 type:complete len:373 (-) Transcript_4930:89-1207(-)